MVRTSIIAAAATACVASVAAADTVDVDFQAIGQATTGHITLDGTAYHVYIGQFVSAFTNGTGPQGSQLNGQRITFCIGSEDLVDSAVTYQVTSVDNAPENSPMGAAAAQAVFNMFDYTVGALGNPFDAGASDAVAAAFQVALWEIVFDYDGTMGSLNTGSGHFVLNSLDNFAATINGHVTNMLAHVSGSAAGAGLMALTNDASQDQIVLVPLPAPAMLGAAGLGGIALVRRRRMRRAV